MSGGAAELRINGPRLLEAIARLAEIGATPDGGAERLAFTPEDGAGRDLVRSWMGGRRTSGPGGRDRQRHRPPGGGGSGRRPGDARLAHRHGRQRRPLRRQPRRARGAGGRPHAERRGRPDPPPPRSCDLFERRGLPLPPGHAGEPGVCGRARPGERLGAPEPRRHADPEGGTRSDRLSRGSVPPRPGSGGVRGTPHRAGTGARGRGHRLRRGDRGPGDPVGGDHPQREGQPRRNHSHAVSPRRGSGGGGGGPPGSEPDARDSRSGGDGRPHVVRAGADQRGSRPGRSSRWISATPTRTGCDAPRTASSAASRLPPSARESGSSGANSHVSAPRSSTNA